MRPHENVRPMIEAYLDGVKILKKGASLDFAFDSWDPVESLADFERPGFMFKRAPVTVKTTGYRRYAIKNPFLPQYEVGMCWEKTGFGLPPGAIWIDTETQYETLEVENVPFCP